MKSNNKNKAKENNKNTRRKNNNTTKIMNEETNERWTTMTTTTRKEQQQELKSFHATEPKNYYTKRNANEWNENDDNKNNGKTQRKIFCRSEKKKQQPRDWDDDRWTRNENRTRIYFRFLFALVDVVVNVNNTVKYNTKLNLNRTDKCKRKMTWKKRNERIAFATRDNNNKKSANVIAFLNVSDSNRFFIKWCSSLCFCNDPCVYVFVNSIYAKDAEQAKRWTNKTHKWHVTMWQPQRRRRQRRRRRPLENIFTSCDMLFCTLSLLLLRRDSYLSDLVSSSRSLSHSVRNENQMEKNLENENEEI